MHRRNCGIEKTLTLILLLLFVFAHLASGHVFGSEPAVPQGHGGGTQAVHAGETDKTGAEGHGSDRTGDLLDLLYRFINFALLVVILGWALKKADIKGMLSRRTEEIRARLEGLKREKEEIETKYRDIEAKLKEFEREREKIIQEYRREGESERDRIIAEAQKKVQKMFEQVEFSIRQEIRSAKDRLRHEVVELAAQQAQEMISRNITEEDQVRLVNEFIEKVGKRH